MCDSQPMIGPGSGRSRAVARAPPGSRPEPVFCSWLPSAAPCSAKSPRRWRAARCSSASRDPLPTAASGDWYHRIQDPRCRIHEAECSQQRRLPRRRLSTAAWEPPLLCHRRCHAHIHTGKRSLRLEFAHDTGALVGLTAVETGWRILDRPHAWPVVPPAGTAIRGAAQQPGLRREAASDVARVAADGRSATLRLGRRRLGARRPARHHADAERLASPTARPSSP